MEQRPLSANQFGSRAAEYLASAVHSSGADLVELTDAVGAAKAARVLDMGCGAGHASFASARGGATDVVAYDLSPAMLAVVAAEAKVRGHAQIHTAQGPAESLAFPDASFELVVTRFSAHHWLDMRQGIHEAARVLKPGGTLIVIDVISPEIPTVRHRASDGGNSSRPVACARLSGIRMAQHFREHRLVGYCMSSLETDHGIRRLGGTHRHLGRPHNGGENRIGRTTRRSARVFFSLAESVVRHRCRLVRGAQGAVIATPRARGSANPPGATPVRRTSAAWRLRHPPRAGGAAWPRCGPRHRGRPDPLSIGWTRP